MSVKILVSENFGWQKSWLRKFWSQKCWSPSKFWQKFSRSKFSHLRYFLRYTEQVSIFWNNSSLYLGIVHIWCQQDFADFRTPLPLCQHFKIFLAVNYTTILTVSANFKIPGPTPWLLTSYVNDPLLGRLGGVCWTFTNTHTHTHTHIHLDLKSLYRKLLFLIFYILILFYV